jgi:signal transduction histidine kinase
MALSDSNSSSVLASILLCVLLGLVAHFVKQGRDSQERTEVLLAELEDARDDQAQAAALAERGRIASELHDVLAHSLSGAAIQLQGARMLSERAGADPNVRAAIERASELVKHGLGDARRAVGALRGSDLPTAEEIRSLVESFSLDMQVDASLHVEGRARPLPAEISLALYRSAQEALTNVARHAPGALAALELRYGSGRTTLVIEDRLAGVSRTPAGELSELGGGRGLVGMRERIERLGGTMSAGPTDSGWRVELDVPA